MSTPNRLNNLLCESINTLRVDSASFVPKDPTVNTVFALLPQGHADFSLARLAELPARDDREKAAGRELLEVLAPIDEQVKEVVLSICVGLGSTIHAASIAIDIRDSFDHGFDALGRELPRLDPEKKLEAISIYRELFPSRTLDILD